MDQSAEEFLKTPKFVDLSGNKQTQVNITANPSSIFLPLGEDSTEGLLDILLFQEPYFSAIYTVVCHEIIVHAAASHHALSWYDSTRSKLVME